MDLGVAQEAMREPKDENAARVAEKAYKLAKTRLELYRAAESVKKKLANTGMRTAMDSRKEV